MAIADDYAAIAAAMKKHAEPQEEHPDIIDLIELATWAWLAVGDPYAHEGSEEAPAS